MTKKIILIFAITIAVAGCNNNTKSKTGAKKQTSSTSTMESESSAMEAILLQTFTYEDISSNKVNNGCLCSFGPIDDEKSFYYVDNRDSLAVIKIDNQFEECKAIVGEKIGENPQVYKKYSNGKYTLEFIGSRSAEKGIEDVSRVTGTLKVTDTTGKMLWAKLLRGICAC